MSWNCMCADGLSAICCRWAWKRLTEGKGGTSATVRGSEESNRIIRVCVFFIFAFNLMVQWKLLLPCCTSVMSKTSCFINLMPFRATYSIRPLNKFLRFDLLIYMFNFLRQVAPRCSKFILNLEHLNYLGIIICQDNLDFKKP